MTPVILLIPKHTHIKKIRHNPSYKNQELKTNQTSFVCGNHSAHHNKELTTPNHIQDNTRKPKGWATQTPQKWRYSRTANIFYKTTAVLLVHAVKSCKSLGSDRVKKYIYFTNKRTHPCLAFESPAVELYLENHCNWMRILNAQYIETPLFNLCYVKNGKSYNDEMHLSESSLKRSFNKVTLTTNQRDIVHIPNT